jgi:hypothetical protein
VRKATVYVNGRRARVLTGRSLRGTITLRALAAGVLRVRVVVQTATGRTFTSRRTYAACR